ncbi:hypothetical protein O181_052308 [Austropuccinia psidii MF-1]|uniref:Uncharacterized protein n=1 Tax=Austropuccinia psidii MF-1 TaxID=1389203 RepID=A0A9Q3E592_9BASI|nr:hypothetical protein [Austropuccinia psidii MF-1]
MKAFPSGNGRWDPKQADGNDSRQLAQSPQVCICPPPLLGHQPMVTSLLYQSKVIIHRMKDGDGKRTFELGWIVTMSCHPLDLNSKEQTLWQPTPGPSGTQWLEDSFHGKQPTFHLIANFDSSELTVPPFVEPSQTNEPPIPGPSPSSKPHEDVLTCEPEPEVALTQSMEEPFGKSQIHFFNSSQLFYTFPLIISILSHSIIIIDNTPIGSPLIPKMRLARNLLTYG